MKSPGHWPAAVVLAFLLGFAVPLSILWNPGGWQWADRLTGRFLAPPTHLGHQEREQLWTCGMHSQVIQEEPGNCPICRMPLQPVKDASVSTQQASPAQKAPKVKYWRAPMDPNFISDKPGKSPMGMDLVPVYEEEEPAAGGIRVDPDFVQSFAVRTAVVERGTIPIEIRTVGSLSYNEKNIVSVNTKFEGWIEKARVNYLGEPVRKGQVLLEIYSPQLVTTQQEYLAAMEYLEKLSAGAYPDAVERARSLLEAAQQRLQYWDITDDQIAELRKSGRVTRRLNIISPVSGVVVEKMNESLEGMKLSPGMNVFKVADLSTIWAGIEVFEHQIQYLKLRQSAEITVDAFPRRRWRGKIAFLNPTVNPQTRTLKAYVEIPNPGWKLRPEMYVNVLMKPTAVSNTVKVPEEAILYTGVRSVVIVKKGETLFEPREVSLGATGDGYREVVTGLEAGETVVTSSQFLIDSESNLKEAISKILSARKSQKEPLAAAPETHRH